MDSQDDLKRRAPGRESAPLTATSWPASTSRTPSAKDTALGARIAAKRRRVRIALALGAVAVLVCAGVGLWLLLGSDSPFYDATARTGLAPTKTPEEIQAELNRVVEEGMFNISIASTIDFATPGAPGTANIENVPGNRYDMKVTITLDATGEQVYASGGIAPGDFIADIELTHPLDVGMHDATAVFYACDPTTHEEVGSASARILLSVGGA